jgi:hypothetical protein
MFIASWFVAAIGWSPMVHETVETKKPSCEKSLKHVKNNGELEVLVWSILNKDVTGENT